MAHLRTARQMRQAKGGTTKSRLGRIVDAVTIRERPTEAEDRAVPGHWEGDLLFGANNTHIATHVERHTRFTMLLKVPNKDTATVVTALSKHVRKLPQQLRRSLPAPTIRSFKRRAWTDPSVAAAQMHLISWQDTDGTPTNSQNVTL